MRWTFYLISDPAAIRSGNNSLGMDLSNCKSLLLLWDTGYPWMTWSLIAPTVPHAKQLALICPGKGRRWCEGSKRKVGVIFNLPALRRIWRHLWALHARASVGLRCSEVSPGTPSSSAMVGVPTTSNTCGRDQPPNSGGKLHPVDQIPKWKPLHGFIPLCHFSWNLLQPRMYTLIPTHRSFISPLEEDVF